MRGCYRSCWLLRQCLNAGLGQKGVGHFDVVRVVSRPADIVSCRVLFAGQLTYARVISLQLQLIRLRKPFSSLTFVGGRSLAIASNLAFDALTPSAYTVCLNGWLT
eukprot:Blabericola_migrator_1__6135@NODE_3099_length_2037_cov_11_044162_g1939_i0_p2_GENE_NODE_3099_length_2037_cov_11_044162_g1939_i0NODE_3099_length_2037_cov_11_044162_g1939_i0_p2_ORF_typecomplete_len106_score0_04_NODE_3099_length_2037_cov_11_044162_g1939_i0629946